MGTTVAEIRKMLQMASEEEFQVLERSLRADTRKGVRDAVDVAKRRLSAEHAERDRIEAMYRYERTLASGRGARTIVGLDEVGRGPLAGPLAVGAVVLPEDARIEGLNDSKQIAPKVRERIAQAIRNVAVAYAVCYVSPQDIDRLGMIACLGNAFRSAVESIEAQGVQVDLILLDGNPLRLDEREVSVVKGDSLCASIAAASVLAKVERDSLMVGYASEYPAYGFDAHKGYASTSHIQAIREYGLTPIHRRSFCASIIQPTLF